MNRLLGLSQSFLLVLNLPMKLEARPPVNVLHILPSSVLGPLKCILTLSFMNNNYDNEQLGQ